MLKSYLIDLLLSFCIGYILRRSDPCLPLLHTHTEDYQLFSCGVCAVGESCTLDVGERDVFVQA